jgi:cobalt-precorrin-5B (C1)-methyltransferase
MPINPATLRSGYTTGACATAATKGALLALLHQRRFAKSRIRLPIGQSVTFELHTCTYTPHEGYSSVIKDAGDDPDVTHQAEICARVTWAPTPGIHFVRGEGVGLVTKAGLPVPPGEPAINPVPRQMMTETAQAILDRSGHAHRGIRIEISVPQGERMAQKTFNPRLGILGGISILGTTGIVVPYSTAAWEASVLQNIDVAVAQGCEALVFVVGGRGERFARRFISLPDIGYVQIGNFFGMALERACQAGVQQITLAGMIGKLAKFAAGHASVHSKQSEQDFEFLARLAGDAGFEDAVVQRILHANTAQEVTEIARDAGLASFHDDLCREAHRFALTFFDRELALDVRLLGKDGDILGRYPPS